MAHWACCERSRDRGRAGRVFSPRLTTDQTQPSLPRLLRAAPADVANIWFCVSQYIAHVMGKGRVRRRMWQTRAHTRTHIHTQTHTFVNMHHSPHDNKSHPHIQRSLTVRFTPAPASRE